MEDMIFTAPTGEEIIFDDYTNNVEEYNSYWVEMCPCCHQKYKSILGNRIDDGGSPAGTCSVKGCWNEADFYVDFDLEDVMFR